ncbi:MAG TPA: hypothetical protein VE130_06840 [Nitrososphaeraceae archaeon]|nr:hypothetical protein [Nitrososphaeraceae archaeon]
MSSSSSDKGEPTVLWSVLEGKKVTTNDGKELGEIKEFSQNYVKVEKGTVRKHSLWIPKYVGDAFDGHTLWLLVSEEEALERFKYGEKEGELKEAPSSERYREEFETFKSSPAGKQREYKSDLEDNIRIVENYENIRNYK